jgi:hypothetical protein
VEAEQPGHETDYTPPSSNRIRNVRISNSAPPSFVHKGALSKHKENLYFHSHTPSWGSA